MIDFRFSRVNLSGEKGAAHLPELPDLPAERLLRNIEAPGQTGEAEKRPRTAVDQLPREGRFVGRERCTAPRAAVRRLNHAP